MDQLEGRSTVEDRFSRIAVRGGIDESQSIQTNLGKTGAFTVATSRAVAVAACSVPCLRCYPVPVHVSPDWNSSSTDACAPAAQSVFRCGSCDFFLSDSPTLASPPDSSLRPCVDWYVVLLVYFVPFESLSIAF